MNILTVYYSLTMIPPLIHLGMLIVGVTYSVDEMIHAEAKGGNPVWCANNSRPQR